jgi:hypothetical protein
MRYEGAWITLSTARGGSFKEIELSRLSLAKPAKVWLTKVWFGLSRLSCTKESTIGQCTQPANSQLIPQSSVKYLGLARLA